VKTTYAVLRASRSGGMRPIGRLRATPMFADADPCDCEDLSPPFPHPGIQVAGRQHPFGIFPIKPLIVGHFVEVAQFHRRTRAIDALGEIPHRCPVVKHRLNPLILETVGQLPRFVRRLSG
jgi:hypothetical protein